MNDGKESDVCVRCGKEFSCGRKAGLKRCWCEDLPPVLPVVEGKDCLCPDCLRAISSASSKGPSANR
jgi:uncharacterized protein